MHTNIWGQHLFECSEIGTLARWMTAVSNSDFIELVYEFPTGLHLPKNEDYFALPVRVADEMGLRACVYSMRTQVRWKRQEFLSGVPVCRFDDPFSLLLSTITKRPLIVHGHSFGWVPSTVSPLFIKRYVFTPHIYRLDLYNTNLVKLVTKAISRSTALIVLTKFEASWFKTHVDEEKIHVIPHPIDFNFFGGAKKNEGNEVRENFGVDDKLILTVTNLVPRKNLETLLKAFKLMNQTMPKAKLIIVGSEPPTVLSIGRPTRPKTHYPQKLRELASTLGLEEKVIFAGYQNCRSLRKFYAAADIFVLPSTVEGQSLTAGEAAAAGLPLALSNLEPLVEVYNGCALFHEPMDYVSLARNVINVLTNEKLAKRLSQRGREKIRKYDIAIIEPKLKTVYENCLKNQCS
jgi:glycosyltransferase involved in cell wall biosynthesis